jgi:hypothetical protein
MPGEHPRNSPRRTRGGKLEKLNPSRLPNATREAFRAVRVTPSADSIKDAHGEGDRHLKTLS